KSIANLINEKRQRYVEILSEIKRIQIEIRESAKERVLKERRKSALEKLNKGERLSLYDLYIALGETTEEKDVEK
ncbi:MAG: hypothetical protein QXX37_07765, partial [Ignisphaera sp.]